MGRSKYNLQDARQWASYYKQCYSFREVGRKFNVNKSTVIRKLHKYKDKLDIEFKNEVNSKLLASELKKCNDCNKIKEITCFDRYKRSSSGRKGRCKDCQRKLYSRQKNGVIYTADDIKQWATEYKKYFSFARVAIIFNVPKSTVRRLLLKHKYELNIKFKNNFLESLNINNKHYCFFCFKIKNVNKFTFRADNLKYNNKCNNCISKKFKLRYKYDISFRKNILKRIYSRDKEAKRIYNLNYYYRNPEKANAWAKNNPEKAREVQRRWRLKNIEKAKAWRREWRYNNIEKIREYDRVRRARKLNINESYSEVDLKITLNVFGKRCFKCKTNDKIHIDHHFPLSAGYALSVENAVPLCPSCNSKKHTKSPEDFYRSHELKEIKKLFEEAKRRLVSKEFLFNA